MFWRIFNFSLIVNLILSLEMITYLFTMFGTNGNIKLVVSDNLTLLYVDINVCLFLFVFTELN